ncbi:MAG: hypothetical protein OQK67_09480 [Chlorobium sp.]|nr:hypothetical protein [Chlorobium sp.]MCW8816093.1 hypothetical protein [Chlorobium sp.]MCW8818768.1 hypothetical protein [Ignavibacteriaceae bacterium]
MKTISTIKSLLAGAILFAAVVLPITATEAPAATRASASGQAKVSTTLPEFIILHYYSDLELNFETPSSEALDEGDNSMNVAWSGIVNGNDELKPNDLKDAKLELDKDLVTVALPNVWAVRGFSPNGKASISIEIPNNGKTLKKGPSIIAMSNSKVTQGKTSGKSINVALNGIAKSRATTGGVTLDLDFMKTTRSGKHTGGLYKITAKTI